MIFGLLVPLALLWLVVLLFRKLFAGFARRILKAGRIALQAVLAGSLAGLCGMLVGPFIAGVADDQGVYSAAAGVLMFAPMLWCITILWRRRHERRVRREFSNRYLSSNTHQNPIAPTERRRDETRKISWPKNRKAKSVSADIHLEEAWMALVDEVDWARSRIAVVRESCAQFLASADATTLNLDALDWSQFIRTNVAEHIETCLQDCQTATPSERRILQEELITGLERVGAEADRRRARLFKTSNSEFNLQREHFRQRTAPDPFSSI